MKEIIVRQCEPKDIAAVREIYSQQHAYAGTLQLPYPTLDLWQNRLEQLTKGSYSYVAEVDGKVIGQLSLDLDQSLRRRHVASFGMGVKQEFQGKGVGSKLLTSAIDVAENWLNVERLELTVYTDNESAIALYKKHGFVIEGESKKYAFRNGQYVDAYQMARVKE